MYLDNGKEAGIVWGRMKGRIIREKVRKAMRGQIIQGTFFEPCFYFGVGSNQKLVSNKWT